VSSKIRGDLCGGCGLCVEYCPAGAIVITEKKATIEGHKCIGCGECLVMCREQAIDLEWNEGSDRFQKKMVEHACGAMAGKKGKVAFISFLMQISPYCDCYPHNDAPIVRDIGILGAVDPVAIDAASCNLVNHEPSMPGTIIKQTLGEGEDKFRAVFPQIDWNIQLDHAQRLGLGEREYTLVEG
jgi:uncharacterized protein